MLKLAVFLVGLICFQTIEINGQEQYFIDPTVTLVERWDGWGTSLAWWADVLGNMDESVIEGVTKSFFDPDKLNLNIVRYVIGGTTPEEVEKYPCGLYRDGGASETYKDGPNESYNWARDERQRKILTKAKDLGVNTFEAFSNSPPQWMTISGCSKGNLGGLLLHNNLDPENATAFVEYATDVIQHFHENFNITFTTYDPFNEPSGLQGIGSWWGWQSSQEGCNMNQPVMAAVVRSLKDALDRKDMTYVTITAADETHINTAVDTHEFFKGEGLSEVISKVNVHGYWELKGNRRDLLSIMTTREGQKLWMDEMGWAESPVDDMTQGLAIANRIILDVRKMLPSAWVYWQAMESPGAWGLLNVPFNETAGDIQYNSGYYAMMQFSKYVKEGFKIVHISDENAIAAYDETTKTLVIVTVNSEPVPKDKIYDLRILSSFKSMTITRTSPSEQNIQVSSTSMTPDNQNLLKVFSLKAEAESITTILLEEVTFVPSAEKNLIKNSDFESQVPTEISTWLGDDVGSGINSNFSWRGSKSGYLNVTSSMPDEDMPESRLSQFLVMDSESNHTTYQLYLTAWCYSTDVESTKVIVEIDDVEVVEKYLLSEDEYHMLSLSFKARKGNSIRVSFASSNGISYIDNVGLHAIEVEEEPVKDSNSGGVNLISKVMLLACVWIMLF